MSTQLVIVDPKEFNLDNAKAEADRLAAIEAELSKGDEAKIEDLKADLLTLKTKYTFKSAKNQKLQTSVNELLDKVITFINDKK